MALSRGVLPRDANRVAIQQQLGIPYVGKIFYVDPTNGNDTTNSGSAPTDALKTIATAYALTTNYNHDVIIIVPGGTSGTAETATITWSNHYTHLIGNTGPVHVSNRARVVWTTDSVDPCLTISGNGCIFKNIQLATYQASNDVLVNITGSRNYFENVHFAGIGHETAGDDATARCVVLNEASENLFKSCTFGLDTVLRSTTNATLELIGATAAARNKFDNCTFVAVCDNAGALFVKFNGAYSSECYTIFKDCMFLNTRGGTTTMTVAMDTAVSLNGKIIMNNCWWLGATDLCDDVTNVYINNPVVNTADGGVFIVHANS